MEAVHTPDLAAVAYISEALGRPALSDLEELADSASRHNAAAGITGFLLYRSDLFVQYLEGPRAEVSALYDRLLVDPRHKIVRRLDVAVTNRRFPSWELQLLSPVWVPDIELNASLHRLLAMLGDQERATTPAVASLIDQMALSA